MDSPPGRNRASSQHHPGSGRSGEEDRRYQGVRELTGQALAEAKTTAEVAPRVIRDGLDAAAAAMRKKRGAAGGVVTVKGN